MDKKIFSKKLRFLVIAALAVIPWSSTLASVPSCPSVFLSPANSAYEIDTKLRQVPFDPETQEDLNVTYAYGSPKPILRSFEKEGLFYEEIREWFPQIKDGVTGKLQQKFLAEKKSKQIVKMFTYWLKNVGLNPTAPVWMRANWDSIKSPEKRWQILSQLPNFFQAITVADEAKLFEYNILNFDDLVRNPNTPELITVGDDLGSYEVRLSKAIPNRQEFQSLRQVTEDYLEGKVGHQHMFHGWPQNAAVREQIAPYYIELLDASSWFLYWRQINRNPEVAESILVHPFLGVYSTATLKMLYQSMLKGNSEDFRSKYNMIGARSFPALPDSEDQSRVIDWELRSGNKGNKREFVENMIEARLVSGDYRGLRDFRQNEGFDTTATVEEVAARFLPAKDLQILAKFEQKMPEMHDAHFEVSNNHYRKRILAPLQPWENRLNIAYKIDLLHEAQSKYAQKFVQIAKRYLARFNASRASKETREEAREEAIEALELANFEFANATRLDLDFERYLLITPTELPSPLVASTGPIDVNQVGLGIEYSVRFPKELEPENQSQAQKLISNLATRIGQKFSIDQTPTSLDNDAHGHGIATKFKIKDAQNQTWRVEWDGIARQYEDGHVINAWGGHTEIVSPKFAPQTLEGSPVQEIYRTARESGMFPNRAAGGAHVNFDLEFLETLPQDMATNAVINLIQYFESNQNIMLSLWSHPSRMHAAYPVNIKPELIQALAHFHGSLKDLGRTLYTYKYFNTFVGRKPKYVPLNLTALMTDIIPREYIEKTLDIKNPTQEWFPNFANVTGRGEARFFDAPTDEAMAALQIKYWRAVLNKTFNTSERIPLVRKYSAETITQMKKDPMLWKQIMTEHLQSLGLNPQEFSRLIWESYAIQSTETPSEKQYVEFTHFLPAR